MSQLFSSWFLVAVAVATVLALCALILVFQYALKSDRTYLDPVPWAWRLFWPSIETIGFWLRPWIKPKQQERLARLIQAIGWHFWISPHQFIALRLVSAGIVAVVIGLIALSLGSDYLLAAAVGALLGWFLPANYARERASARRLSTLRQLPFFIDLLILGVESGQPLSLAMSLAISHGAPGPLRDELKRMQRDLRAGKGRQVALEDMGLRMAQPEVSTLVSTLNLAEQHGMQLGPLLRAQSETRRNERFARAEKLAMQAPVKMLFPLIFCIFPGTFAIILFPIALQLLSGASIL
jgi:tight adherence protein C